MPTHIPQHQRQTPAPTQQPVNPNQILLEQMVQAMGQQQQLAQQAPQPRTGFLAPGQGGARDVLTNPSQEQVTAALTGLLHAANPNSRAPLLSGFAGGMSALQSQRAREFEARKSAYDAQTKQLQQRIENLGRTAGVADQIQGRQMDRERLGLEGQRVGISRDAQELRETEFLAEMQEADVERYMDPDTGRITEFKKDRFGNVMYNGQPVNPTEIGMVPYDRQLYQDTQERLQGTRKQAAAAFEMKDLIFDAKFPAAVGRFDVRRRAAEGLGLGQETEILTKRAKELTGTQLINDLEQMGARPSDRDLAELKKIHLSANDDPEVWQDKYLNRILPTYYNALSRQFGDQEARERLKPLIEGIPKSRIYEGVQIKAGSITDQLMNPPPQEPTGGGPVINPDNTGGTTSGGYKWRVVPAE